MITFVYKFITMLYDQDLISWVVCAQARSTECGLYAIRGRSGCLAHMRCSPVAVSEDRACEIWSEVGKVASL